MMLYRNKYRVETTRLSKWDYSSPGYYFITICTYDRGCLFGKIAEDLMALNEYGEIAKDEWNKTGKQRLNLQLDEFIVMPNHLHGIVRLLDSVGSRQSNRFDYSNRSRDVARYVSTINPVNTGNMENTGTKTNDLNKTTITAISPAPNSLSAIVRSFKSAITKRVNEIRKTPSAPVFQPRFHDHIIRNDRELFAIRQYIRYNPANWDNDRDVLETREGKSGKQPWFVYMG